MLKITSNVQLRLKDMAYAKKLCFPSFLEYQDKISFRILQALSDITS